MRLTAKEIEHLRRSLPMAAYPRRQLLAFLQAQGVQGRATPKLAVIDIFSGGDNFGLMCRFFISSEDHSKHFVALLSQIALDRRFSFACRDAGGTRARALRLPI
jgi:hypothetical protein